MSGKLIQSLAVLCALMVLAAGALPAKAELATYSVSHTYSLSPLAPGGQNPVEVTVGYRWQDYATASPDGDPRVDDHAGNGLAGTAGGTFPPAIAPQTADSVGTMSEGHSDASVKVDPWKQPPPNPIVIGVLAAKGRALTKVAPSSAYASSSASVVVRGGKMLRNGKIQWGPRLRQAVSGIARASVHDPISFSVMDLVTLEELEGTLLDIEAELDNMDGGGGGGGGAFQWDDGTLSLADAWNFDFTIDMTSPYTLQQGAVEYRVHNGVVTTSRSTGVFANMALPGVGAGGDFSFPMSDISIDYDLGDFGDHELDAGLDFGGGGEGTAQIPEPATLSLALGALVLLKRRRA